MNPILIRKHAAKLASQGLELDEIGERVNRDAAQASAFVLARETGSVCCDRCKAPVGYYSARRIGNIDFCRGCQRALFADYTAAAEQYPELFGPEEGL